MLCRSFSSNWGRTDELVCKCSSVVKEGTKSKETNLGCSSPVRIEKETAGELDVDGETAPLLASWRFMKTLS